MTNVFLEIDSAKKSYPSRAGLQPGPTGRPQSSGQIEADQKQPADQHARRHATRKNEKCSKGAEQQYFPHLGASQS